MAKALIASGLVAGTVWCWVKLVAPWVQALELHEEILEILRELPMPQGQRSSPAVDCTQDLANLAAAISTRSRIANAREGDTVAALNDGGKQMQESPR